MKKINEALKQDLDTGISKTKDGYRVSYKFNGKHLSFGERKRLNDAIALNNNVKVILELARGNNKKLLAENRQLKGKVTELEKEILMNKIWTFKSGEEAVKANKQLLDAHYTIARLKKRNLWQRILNKDVD